MIVDKIEISPASGIVQIRYRMPDGSDQFHRQTIERGDSSALISALGSEAANQIINTYWGN